MNLLLLNWLLQCFFKYEFTYRVFALCECMLVFHCPTSFKPSLIKLSVVNFRYLLCVLKDCHTQLLIQSRMDDASNKNNKEM